jgi:FkbM family methyltransferase
MFAHTLAKIAARVPSTWKYKAKRLRPLYSGLMALGQHRLVVRTGAGEFSWVVDESISQAFLLGTYEPYMQDALRRFLKLGDVFYDIGAHVGFHSFVGALLVGPAGRVFAFEPNPLNQECIRKQISENPHLPVSIVPYAIFDHSGPVRFRAAENSSQGCIREDGEWTVEGRTLDCLLDNGTLPPPAVIKIDVEGSESAVLSGAVRLIADHRPVVLCDYNDGTTLDMVRQHLGPLGYEILQGPPVIARPVSVG